MWVTIVSLRPEQLETRLDQIVNDLGYRLSLDVNERDHFTLLTDTLEEMQQIGTEILTQVQAIRDYEQELGKKQTAA